MKFEIGSFRAKINKRKGKIKYNLKLSGNKFSEVITHTGEINIKYIVSKLFLYLDSLKSSVKQILALPGIPVNNTDFFH